VGGVGAEAGGEFADEGFEFSDAAFEGRDPRVSLRFVAFRCVSLRFVPDPPGRSPEK
jgi:hypothetical protein